ncbi:PRC-barrel domain-containing protein [Azoarcus sp. DN11]|uniref:PRC-barrel domain-containing protein n=1 Tax=Azoarcus sp. DN11 TaxID=356837 RepID=UPI000EB1BA05|nr:PRC-barrel domain-containing protein [Azoarcus sp. DN11]AYH41995.1 hypothetical protein CDA09_01125 [Azoarcus sp. DN11]
MSSMKRKSMLAVAITALVAVPAGALAGMYGEGPGSHQMHSQMGTSGQLQTMTPSQLLGTEVVGTNGETIGTVKTVVQSRQEKNIQAVIAASGLGLGNREIAVPLDSMRYEEGKLRLSASADELKARPAYRAEQYVEVRPTDQPISEFSAFETVSGRAAPHRGSMWDRGSSNPNAFYPESNQFTP